MSWKRSGHLSLGAAIAGGAALSVYVVAVRPWHRRWGATDQEVAQPMLGDEAIEDPKFVSTRAVTIKAKPAEVWPWLMQMGFERGGMYSYDWVDRAMGILDEESSWQILPEYQELKVGDLIPMGSGPSWPVKSLDPYRSLVLYGKESNVEFSWSYLLEEVGEGQTRLILRIRVDMDPKPWDIPLLLLMDPGEFLMTRKHLLGIKARAEALAKEGIGHLTR